MWQPQRRTLAEPCGERDRGRGQCAGCRVKRTAEDDVGGGLAHPCRICGHVKEVSLEQQEAWEKGFRIPFKLCLGRETGLSNDWRSRHPGCQDGPRQDRSRQAPLLCREASFGCLGGGPTTNSHNAIQTSQAAGGQFTTLTPPPPRPHPPTFPIHQTILSSETSFPLPALSLHKHLQLRLVGYF